MIKRREKTKREHLHLSVEIFEKRYQTRDFSGHLLAELSTKNNRPAFAPIYTNQYSHNSPLTSTAQPQSQWTGGTQNYYSATQYSLTNSTSNKRELDGLSVSSTSRKEKRQYKKRKHKNQREKQANNYASPGTFIKQLFELISIYINIYHIRTYS